MSSEAIDLDLEVGINGLLDDDTGRLSKGMTSLSLDKKRVLPPIMRTSKDQKPAIHDDDSTNYVPVNCLNTYVQDWVIKVRVTKKYALKHWNNNRGSGTLMNVDFVDRSRQQIQATFYNDAALKFNEILQEDHTYTCKGGQVKIANKRYTTIPNDHCLSFDVGAEIVEVAGDDADHERGTVYSFTNFRKIMDAAQGQG